MGNLTVSVRCVVVPVRVTLGYGRFVSPIEQIVLKKLTLHEADGLDEPAVYGADELARSLGLGQRLTLDIISDLWHKNYITLDLARGVVRAADHVRRRAAQGTLHELEGAEVHSVEYPLMVDSLTGTLMPVNGSPRPQEGHHVVPVLDRWATDDTFTQAELADALHEHLRQERRQERRQGAQGREQRVLTAQLVPADLRPPPQNRWLPLSITVGWDNDAQKIRLFSDDPAFPTESRLRALSRIAELLETLPENAFATQVRRAANSQFVEAPSLETALERLEEAAAGVSGSAPGTQHARHNELARQSRQVTELLRLRVASEVRTRVVVDPDDHRETVVELIERARRQIVLACPSVGYEPLYAFSEHLRQALARGVHVVLLWGERHGDEVSEKVRNLLNDLRRAGRGKLVWTYRPSRTHACLAVCDDRAALVTGHRFLSPPPPRHGREGRDRQNRALQVGVRVEAPTSGPCDPVEGLLRWARTAVPDYSVGQKVHIRHSDFTEAAGTEGASTASGGEPPGDAARQGEAEEERSSSWEPLLPGLPAEPAVPADGAPPSAAVTAVWGQAWVEYAAALRRQLEARTLPWAMVQVDGAHRETLWQALRHSRSRLLLSGARVGPDAFDFRASAALEKLLRAGVRVTVAHGRPTESTGVAEGPRRLLAGLKAAFADRGLQVVQQATNARLMVSDDEALVGSFDLLSLGSQAPGLSHKRPSEIGLRLIDRRTADQLVDAVHGAPQRDAPDSVESSPPTAAKAEAAAPDMAGRAQRLLNTVAEEAPSGDPAAVAALARDCVEQLATQGGDAVWALLDTLRRHDAYRPVLRPAAAYASGRFAGSPEARTWRRWLMRDCWERGMFVEAVVLRAAIPGDHTRPRLPLSLVAAARGGAHFDEAVLEAALDVEDSLKRSRPWAGAEAAALVSLCVAEILTAERGDAAAEALDLLEQYLAEPWRALSRLGRDHWGDSALGPVPVAEIRAQADRARHRTEVDRAWEELSRRHGRAAQVTFRFQSGTRTHARLFGPDGDFGCLKGPIDARDGEAVRQWLAAHPASDVDRVLDRATRSVGATHELRLMANNQRLNFVARLVEVAEGAADLVALLNADSPAGTRRLAGHAPVARALSSLLPRVVAAAEDLDGPEPLLARDVLARLSDIAAWGGSI
ncbi:hypothetical protein LO771_11575 [Streptacidiphilus sp. ASG 303]|uniref:hypothetical protein n=1 Tax=Streptacidiphilus sp. ASG 303 TaxID=2896847 RepID=UPI001E39A69D|nr:hypothetical protein [Streptacidiphilus sp. ASG 303]MCD0483023.1 hypothetical protein [Streptacidiphilus sp. ASG 303]